MLGTFQNWWVTFYILPVHQSFDQLAARCIGIGPTTPSRVKVDAPSPESCNSGGSLKRKADGEQFILLLILKALGLIIIILQKKLRTKPRQSEDRFRRHIPMSYAMDIPRPSSKSNSTGRDGVGHTAV